MIIMIWVLITIIVVLLMAGYVLLDTIEYEKKQNDEFYKQLRKEYDIKIEKYKHDLDEKNQLIRNYNNILLKG